MKIKEIVGLAISIIDNRKDLGKYTYCLRREKIS